MEKIAIIKDLETILSNEFKLATIFFGNAYIPLNEFLENSFINFVKEGADPEVLAQYIQTKLKHLIRLNDPKLVRVDEFINNNPMFIDVIRISKDQVISAREYLNSYCARNMNEDGTISYPGKSITIEDLYLKLLDNQYHEPTIEEKAELCHDMLRYIDKEILDSIVDGYDVSVRDYISKILPTKMDSATTVEVVVKKDENEKHTKSVELETIVTELVDHQRKMLEEKKAKEIEDLENKYNKTGDNPGLVSEIRYQLEEDNSLVVTAEIPVVISSLLTDEEKNSLLSNYVKMEGITSEEYFNTELNRVKLAIDNTNNAHDLDTCEKFFKSVVSETSTEEVSQHIKILIDSIEELIVTKRNNIIKVNGNQEEYTDVLFSEINMMNDELNGFTTLDEYSTLYGRALDRYQEVLAKGIKDIQLKSSFHQLFERINEKRLNLDATIGYQSPEVERAKVELNAIITDIKQDLLTIEHDSNNLGNLAGTEIRLNSNIQKAREEVEKAYNEKLLTEDDREYYMNRLKGYSIAIQSEAKIGYGLN